MHSIICNQDEQNVECGLFLSGVYNLTHMFRFFFGHDVSFSPIS